MKAGAILRKIVGLDRHTTTPATSSVATPWSCLECCFTRCGPGAANVNNQRKDDL